MTYDTTSGSTSSANRRTVTAFFDSHQDAEAAVERLIQAGVSRESMRLVPGAQGGSTAGASGTGGSGISEAAFGTRASGGSASSTGTGTSMSSGYSSTSGSGTTTSGGTGFWESLKDVFLPEEDRHVYAEGLSRGGYLLTVTTAESNYERVLDILEHEGTVDVSQRESEWRKSGWTGYTGSDYASSSATGAAGLASANSRTTTSTERTGASAAGLTGGTGATATTGNTEAIPIVEERLNIGKREVNHGRVRVRSYVVETPVEEQVRLREERVNVERRPVDRPITDADRVFQDRVIEVEQKSEEAVVSKEARVKEELVLNKQVEEQTRTVSDKVRRTEVEVEDERGTRVGGASGTTNVDATGTGSGTTRRK